MGESSAAPSTNRAVFDPDVSGFTASPLPVPDVVTFVAPCPDGGHPAEWTEHREDTRSRPEFWCPACGVAS